MANDRYRGDDTDRDYYGRSETQDYGRDYGARTGGYSSARDYAAAGRLNRDDDRNFGGSYGSSQGAYGTDRGGYGSDRESYGSRGGSYGYDQTGYGRDDDPRHSQDFRSGRGSRRDEGGFAERYGSSYGNRDYYGGQRVERDQDRFGSGDRDRGSYGSQEQSRGGYGQQDRYRGSSGNEGRRFAEGSTYGGESAFTRRDNNGFGPQQRPGDHWTQGRGQNRDYGRQPQGYDYEERGFFSRAGDEVRSWFGDDEAERRREMDQRNDERYARQQGSGGRHPNDDHYHSWRRSQMDALDRDYDEYRQENATKFENEFSSWRTERQGQRNSLNQVTEHMEVVGSDGAHIGTVDKVRGDRIMLTKNDSDAGGRHHSIPSRWIQTVDTKVTVRKTASEAKAHWRDEERNSAFFNENGNEHHASSFSGSSTTAGASTTGSSATGSATGTAGTSGSSTGASATGGSTGQGEGAHNLNKSFSGTY